MIEAVETRRGTIYIPDTDSGQYWWLKMIGDSPEHEYIDMICVLLRERGGAGMAIDVGANFGCWTLGLAHVCKRILAIEPQPQITALLRHTIKANRFTHVELIAGAAGERAGTVGIPDIDPDLVTNFGGISVGEPHPEHPESPLVQVPVYSIDSLPGVNDVAFIKVDVEGSELDTLKGAKKTIGQDRPVLFVECDHPKTDTAELAWFIESLGYSIESHGNNFLGMPI